MPPHGPWKSRTALGVTLGVVGGAIVLMVALIAGFAMRGEGTVTSSPSPVATRPTLPSPAPTNTPPPLPTTRPTAPRPTVPKPTATRTTVKPPPPRRMPPKPPGDRQVMGGDPFYRTGAMASAGCRLPDVALSNKSGVTVYYGALLRCLNNGWPRNVRAGHDVFRRPRMLMVAGYVDSPCGGTAMPRSYYCGGNEVIYMRYDQDIKQYNKYPEYYQKVFARMWAMFTVAHEYGHHVQQMTGILDAYARQRYASNYDTGLELSRRLELQASCLGNIFLGANRRSLPITGENFRQYDWAISHTIDIPHDHGNAQNHTFWSHRGYRTRLPSQCNTFTASPRMVR